MTAAHQQFTPAELADARTRWDVIAGDVPMKRKGRELAGICPFHNERSPSFYVAPDKGFFHCFGCGAHGTVIDYVMRARSLEFVDAVREILGLPMQAPRIAAAPPPREVAPDDESQAEIEKILAGCTEITETTPAHLYLYSRGLRARHRALLAHPALECWELGRDEHGAVRTLPGLVAPITNSADEITALLRIFVSTSWVPGQAKDARAPLKVRKKGVGVMGDGAVRIAPLDRVLHSLGVAEGVETGCAAWEEFRTPTWAACGTARFGFPGHWRERHAPKGERPRLWFPPDRPPRDVETAWLDERPPSVWIPEWIEHLTVFGDNGETGEIVANFAADYWRRQGLDAEACFPPPKYSDFNDQLLGRLF